GSHSSPGLYSSNATIHQRSNGGTFGMAFWLAIRITRTLSFRYSAAAETKGGLGVFTAVENSFSGSPNRLATEDASSGQWSGSSDWLIFRRTSSGRNFLM